jgi:hypothetical protein
MAAPGGVTIGFVRAAHKGGDMEKFDLSIEYCVM